MDYLVCVMLKGPEKIFKALSYQKKDSSFGVSVNW